MPEDEYFSLYVQCPNVDAFFDGIQLQVANADAALKELQEKANKIMRQIVGGTRATWGIIQGSIRAAGGAISMTQRLLVSSLLGAVQVLTPLLWAAFHGGWALKDPTMIINAVMGLAEVATSISALVAFDNNQKDLSRQLRGVNFVFVNIAQLFNSVNFF